MGLIDRGSASASEIVARRSRTAAEATLVGQRSFGKGTVQQWQELAGEGGAFRLTIARWLTQTKRWIHGVGIGPDVAVDIPAVGVPSQDQCSKRRSTSSGLVRLSRPADPSKGSLHSRRPSEHGFAERKEVMCGDRQYA